MVRARMGVIAAKHAARCAVLFPDLVLCFLPFCLFASASASSAALTATSAADSAFATIAASAFAVVSTSAAAISAFAVASAAVSAIVCPRCIVRWSPW